MGRWILLAMAVLGFGLCFAARSAGILAVGLVVGIIGGLGFVLALAADRIAANARPEASMASVEDLVALRKRGTAAARPPPVAATPLDTNVFNKSESDHNG
jgi:hypothetical protein